MTMRIACLLVLCLGASARAFAAGCAFGVGPAAIEMRGDGSDRGLLQYWDLPSDQLLDRVGAPDSTVLAEHRDLVKSRLSIEPAELLERYRPRSKVPADLHNVDVVLAARLGRVRAMNCIEGLLLEEQIKRNPKFSVEPTEFLAFYLRRNGRLRVYFLTNDSGGIRGFQFSRLVERVDGDKDDGWSVFGNLHNHSFFLDRLAQDDPQGVLAPSSNDVQVLKAQIERLDLEGAYITNGFHTLHIPAGDVPLYRGK
ncbi:MAG: hypothetical protein HY078_07595 [Elusimicrobia bacterium]|nr:hypothetical protein [Elusimicrobiota bacterium]